MGRRLVIGVMVASLVVGGPLLSPVTATAEAQGTTCYCSASFDAIDSDLRFIGRYYNWTIINAPSDEECAGSCDGWRRDWFYRNACEFPIRINRGRNAFWEYQNGSSTTFTGPDTWWCPFPPP